METISSESMSLTLDQLTDSVMVFKSTLNFDSIDSTYNSYIYAVFKNQRMKRWIVGIKQQSDWK